MSIFADSNEKRDLARVRDLTCPLPPTAYSFWKVGLETVSLSVTAKAWLLETLCRFLEETAISDSSS